MYNSKERERRELDLKFATRCSVLIKTPQYKELKSIAKRGSEAYQNSIMSYAKPLKGDDYILNLGRWQGIERFFRGIESAAANKEEYARKLTELK